MSRNAAADSKDRDFFALRLGAGRVKTSRFPTLPTSCATYLRGTQRLNQNGPQHFRRPAVTEGLMTRPICVLGCGSYGGCLRKVR